MIYFNTPIAVVARSTVWVCGRSLARIAGSNPTKGMGHNVESECENSLKHIYIYIWNLIAIDGG